VPLLVSSTFHCTALPFFYHTLVLHSRYQSASSKHCAHAFLAYPVCTLVLPNWSPEDAGVFRVLKTVDVTYLLRPSAGNSSVQALRAHNPSRPGTYLNQPAPCVLLDVLVDAVTAR
jgi:hypothetical protein